MADFTAGFELGSNGATIATTDPGNATQWDVVNGTPIYSNAQAAHGSLSARFSTGSDFVVWNMTASDHYGRIYLYATGTPSANARPLIVRNAADSILACIGIDNTAKIVAEGVGASNLGSGAVSVAFNQWVRIEWHIIHAASGTCQIKLFNTMDSTTVSDTVTGSGDTSGTPAKVRLGGEFFNWPASIYLDDIVANATAYPGPIITATVNPPPPIYGRGAC